MSELDKGFFDRADAHISLSNKQISEECSAGVVSASHMFSVARFNAWVSACGFNDAKEMKQARQESIDYFVEEYKIMLEDNLDEYIDNFDTYMKASNE